MLTVSLVTLGSPDRLTGGYLYHRRLADAAYRHGAQMSFACFPFGSFPYAAGRAGRVMAEAQRGTADIVVVDSIVAALLAPWLRLHRLVRPMVAMLHQPPGGIDHGAMRAYVQAVLDRSTYRRAARLLVASSALADELESASLPRHRIRVVPPGRDVAGTVETPSDDLRRGRRAAFLCVGNWVPRKGILELLEAFGRLPPDIGTLHLVGDAEVDRSYAANVRRRMARADLAGRVITHGPVSTERVAGYYATADVFVLPSWKEPYGTVYGEAMAAGLPVVGWAAGNLVHLADNEREGVLVPPGDIDALAKALEELASDDARRRSLASAARRRAESFTTWERTAELFFSCLREALDEPDPPDSTQ